MLGRCNSGCVGSGVFRESSRSSSPETPLNIDTFSLALTHASIALLDRHTQVLLCLSISVDSDMSRDAPHSVTWPDNVISIDVTQGGPLDARYQSRFHQNSSYGRSEPRRFFSSSAAFRDLRSIPRRCLV